MSLVSRKSGWGVLWCEAAGGQAEPGLGGSVEDTGGLLRGVDQCDRVAQVESKGVVGFDSPHG